MIQIYRTNWSVRHAASSVFGASLLSLALLARCVDAQIHNVDSHTSDQFERSISLPFARNGNKENKEVDSIFHWRKTKNCGVSSCYLMLRYLGIRARYDEVRRVVPVGPKGTSIAELQRGFRELDVPTEIIRVSAENLNLELLPAIAHVVPENSPTVETGHYILVTFIDEHFVYIIDPTVAAIQTVPRGDFFRAWSGILLVAKSHWKITPLVGAIALSAQVVAITLVIVSLGYHRAVHTQMLFCMLLMMLTFVAGCSQENSSAVRTVSTNRPSMLDSGILALTNKRYLGVLRENETATGIFTIVNTSTTNIQLDIGHPSCACTSASLSEHLLLAGKKCELEMTLSAHNKCGHIGATVVVAARGTQWAQTFRVTAVALGSSLSNDTLLFNAGDKDTTASLSGKIYCLSDVPECEIELLDLHTTDTTKEHEPTLFELLKIDPPRIRAVYCNEDHNCYEVRTDIRLRGLSDQIRTELFGILQIRVRSDGAVDKYDCSVRVLPTNENLTSKD